MVALLLTACGGGEPTALLAEATCDSSRLWAAHPSTSGSAIPDNNSQGITVRWENQNCALKSVSSVKLELCLKHDRPSDLVWSLTHPSSTSPTNISVSNNWNTNDEICQFNSGKFQRVDLHLGNNIATRGDWALQVKDTQLGDAGTLIQWRLISEGLK
jgi:subtilisin-like proprotein convertase family protein